MANSVDNDQIAPSGYALFADAILSETIVTFYLFTNFLHAGNEFRR